MMRFKMESLGNEMRERERERERNGSLSVVAVVVGLVVRVV